MVRSGRVVPGTAGGLPRRTADPSGLAAGFRLGAGLAAELPASLIIPTTSTLTLLPIPTPRLTSTASLLTVTPVYLEVPMVPLTLSGIAEMLAV